MAVKGRQGEEPAGRYVDRQWEFNPAAQGRRGRRAGRYRAFVPDPVAERDFALDGEAGAALNRATKALERLQHAPARIATLGAVAQNLLRSESVVSSRIEGVLISQKRLARATHLGPGRGESGRTAAEVLGNVEAMRKAIEVGAESDAVEVGDLTQIHRLLLRFADDYGIAGVVRTTQNWIGGNEFNPLDAAYVPPPPEHVPALLEDLCRFTQRDDLDPVSQAAIAHAQFETIHPFADGNGRAGRALIYAVLRRRGEISRYLPPISLLLAGAPRDYIGGLNAYRDGNLSEWCELFALATEAAAGEALNLAEAIEDLEGEWLRRASSPRADSAARRLIAALPEQPVFDAAAAQRLTDRSHVAVNSALRRLEQAGVVRRLNERKWGRAWECTELLELVEAFERSVTDRQVDR